jgi:polysaccharide export outer membrane protein
MEKHLSKYVKNPVVTVYVTGFVGRYSEQVRVLGEAASPQALQYRDQMSVLDVMIAVGGLTQFAAGDRATIVRTVEGQQQQFRVRLDSLIKDGNIAANVYMAPGDVLIIPEAWF